MRSANYFLSRNVVREIRFFSLFASISACTILQPHDDDDDDDDYCCCYCCYYFPDYFHPETEYLPPSPPKCNITASFKGEWLQKTGVEVAAHPGDT